MSFDFMKPGAWRANLAAEDEGGAGGGAGDPPAGGTGGDNPGDGSGGGAARWWEDERFNDDQRGSLTALGLTVDDPLDAVTKLVDMESSAKRKLKAPPDSLIGKPAEGQELAEWKKANAALFGIPEKPEDYKIDRPENWPKEESWDDATEARLREIAHKHGAEPGLVQDVVNIYAEKMLALGVENDTALKAANDEMMAELGRDWGDQLAANLTRAQQAAALVAEQAGLDGTAIAQISGVLTKAAGNANTLRLFAAIGQMMGEDSLAKAGGATGLGMTPAEARAELARLRSPGGEYYEATKPGARAPANFAEIKAKIDRLTKISAG